MAEHLRSEAKDVCALIKMYDYYNASKQLNKVLEWVSSKSRCDGSSRVGQAKATGSLLA